MLVSHLPPGEVKMSIMLTEAAATEIKRVMDEQNREELKYVRVGVVGGGCSGFQYAFNFTGEFFQKDLSSNLPKCVCILGCLICQKKSLYFFEYKSELK